MNLNELNQSSFLHSVHSFKFSTMIFYLVLVIFVTAISAESSEAILANQKDPTFEYLNLICGQENSNINTKQYPWAVAFLKKENGGNLRFICGGNLISTKTVVGVAHCFNDYFGTGLIKPENFLVSLGGDNPSTKWKDAVNIEIEKIIIHPGYNREAHNFHSDLALVYLKRPIIFSESIKPICLWQEVTDAIAIDDATGIITGWNGRGRPMETTIPTLVNARIVTEAECLRSNPLFSQITSNTTLCADIIDKNAELVSSGNGLMFKYQNKWMLRAMAAGGINSGDFYLVFTDITKFNDWIRSNMLL